MIRLFRVLVPNSVLALILSEITLIYTCYLIAAYWILDFSADVFLTEGRGLLRITIVSLLIVVGLHFHDLYDSFRIRSRIVLLQQFCFVLGVAFLFQAFLSYGRWDIILPKWLMVYGSALVLLIVPTWRILFSSTMSRALGSQKVLFLGSSQAVQEISAKIAERPELGMSVLGYVDDDPAASQLSGLTRLGGMEQLAGILKDTHPDRVVVGLGDRRGSLPFEPLLAARLTGTHIEEATNTYETVFHRVSTRDLRPSELIFSEDAGPAEWKFLLQSVYSWLIGAVGLVLALPLMALIAILVKLTSPGPVLFRQERVGRYGKHFTLYKFRSMWVDAEAKTGAVWAARNDPRVTPLGRWLRKLRIDELPQLLNVVRGEMSIVGPRPERPEFVDVLQKRIPYYQQRFAVKPGITGWAQINHKYGDTIEDAIVKLEYDLYYIKNLSMALDLFVMFHTLKTVLTGRGAQ